MSEETPKLVIVGNGRSGIASCSFSNVDGNALLFA